MIKYLDEDVQVSSASSLPKLEIPQDDKYMLGKLSRVEGDTWASTPPPYVLYKMFQLRGCKEFQFCNLF